MSSDPIAPVVEFHEQISRLSAAGLPFDLGFHATGSPSNLPTLKAAMQRVEAALRLRVELHQPLPQAIAEATELTFRHRTALLAWINSGQPAMVLDSLTAGAQSRVQLDQRMGVSLIQPLVLFVLTLAAFGLLCTVTAPRLEAIYLQLWKQPTGLLVWLLAIRDALPIWLAVVAVMLLLSCIWWSRRAAGSKWRWLPGGKQYLDALRYAAFADQVAQLVERGVPVEQSLVLADADLAALLKSDAVHAPPLLNWALTNETGDEPLQNVFRFAANSYRQAAEQRSLGVRLVLPALLLSLVGGALVFAFGLSLFVPMTDLLKNIAIQGGV